MARVYPDYMGMCPVRPIQGVMKSEELDLRYIEHSKIHKDFAAQNEGSHICLDTPKPPYPAVSSKHRG